MRVLITGGFGFVGGRVAQHLQQAGHQVVLGSRRASGSPTWLPQAEVVPTNWHDTHALAQICHGVDVVIQAAGMIAQDCAADPVAALEFNGLATARLVAAAARSSVKRFIYLSTAHVYASPLIGTITEDTCPRNLHPYATSHLAGENAVLSASQHGEFEGIVLRLSNAFGTPVHGDVNCWLLLVNDLCRQAVHTGRMVLKTDGLQQRDFVGLTEVCRVIAHLAVDNDEPMQTVIFNVGSGVSQSVLEMAQLIQQRCAQVCAFDPVLTRVQGGVEERHPTLTYRADQLAAIGIRPHNSDKVVEIDNLLRYCQSTFTQTFTPNA